MSFLNPSGRFGVGSVTTELIDGDRPSHLLSSTAGRRLFLKVWYPAVRGTPSDNEPIWNELRRDARAPLAIRALLWCFRRRTATQPNALLDINASPSTLVVYNHGLISFAAESTSLMQELASHGYIAVAIQHAEQLAELQALSRTESSAKKKADAALARRLQIAAKPERPKLALAYYRASTNTNRLAVERSADTSFVLDHIESVLATVPGARTQAIDTSSAHLIGFSVGGAVATETAKRDARAGSVVNLDGGMHGTIDASDLRQPYLMMYSAANDSGNDELLPSHAQRLTPAGTTHLNYHDVAGLLVALRFAGITGRTNPRLFLEHRNGIVLNFYQGLKRPA